MPKRRANGEGNIRKRKDGRWKGRCTAGYDPESGKRIIKNVLGKTQAYAFLRCFRPGFSVRGSRRGSKCNVFLSHCRITSAFFSSRFTRQTASVRTSKTLTSAKRT